MRLIEILVTALLSIPLIGFLVWKRLDDSTYKKIINIKSGTHLPKAQWHISPTTLHHINFMKESRKKNGNIFFFYGGGIPYLVVADPQLAKEVLSTKRNQFYIASNGFLKPMFGAQNLLFEIGEIWKRQHKVIAPAFKATTIQQYIPIIRSAAQKYMIRLNELCNSSSNKIINMVIETSNYSLDVITCVAFNGMKVGNEINEAYFNGLKASFFLCNILLYTIF